MKTNLHTKSTDFIALLRLSVLASTSSANEYKTTQEWRLLYSFSLTHYYVQNQGTESITVISFYFGPNRNGAKCPIGGKLKQISYQLDEGQITTVKRFKKLTFQVSAFAIQCARLSQM